MKQKAREIVGQHKLHADIDFAIKTGV